MVFYTNSCKPVKGVFRMALIKAIRASDLAEGKMALMELNGKSVLLANIKGAFYAMDNTCAHRGGQLNEGDLSDNIVTCPLHRARYDLTTGKVDPDTGWAKDVSAYPVKTEEGFVWVEV